MENTAANAVSARLCSPRLARLFPTSVELARYSRQWIHIVAERVEVTVKLASGPVDVRFEIKRIHPSPSANTTARTCYAHLVTFSTKTPDELGRNCRSPMFSWSWLAFQGRFALARTVSTRCSSFSPSHSQTLSASQCFPFVLDFTSNRYSRLGRWFARYTRERLHRNGCIVVPPFGQRPANGINVAA